MTAGNLSRIVAYALSVDAVLGPVVAALGTAAATAGVITSERAVTWAGLGVAVLGIIAKVLTAIQASAAVGDHLDALAATTVPSRLVVATAAPDGSIRAGDAHPAITGTELDPTLPISQAQVVATVAAVVLPVDDPPVDDDDTAIVSAG